METPHIYYNAITITDHSLGFIVGLIQEVYSTPDHRGRSRQLLAYQPHLPQTLPALPVYHEQLRVMTRSDWQQTNAGERIAVVTDFFTTYSALDRLTFFQTFTPPETGTTRWHVLPDTYWPNRIANARRQLYRDLSHFRQGKSPTLPQTALPLRQLGYFPA